MSKHTITLESIGLEADGEMFDIGNFASSHGKGSSKTLSIKVDILGDRKSIFVVSSHGDKKEYDNPQDAVSAYNEI